MYSILKDDLLETSRNRFLEWRFRNFEFWFNQIESLVTRIFARYGYDVSLTIEDSNPRVYNGFNPLNVKVMKLHTKLKDESDETLYIPIPNRYDVFDVNSSLYILKAELCDKPIVAYDRLIRIRYFKIEDGLFFIPRGAKIPLVALLVHAGKLSKSDFVEVESYTGKDVGVTKGNVYYRYKKYSGKPFDDMILQSLKYIKDLSQIDSYKTQIASLNRFVLETFFLHLLELFYGFKNLESKTTLEIISDCLDVAEKLYNEYGLVDTFISTRQKYVVYYDAIVEYMCRKCFDMVLQRKNIQKYRVDSADLLKWLITSNPRFELVTSMETPWREVNLKETIATMLKEPTAAQRTCDLSYLYRIDPINTPDNEKLGVIQRVAKTVELDELGRFEKLFCEV